MGPLSRLTLWCIIAAVTVTFGGFGLIPCRDVCAPGLATLNLALNFGIVFLIGVGITSALERAGPSLDAERP